MTNEISTGTYEAPTLSELGSFEQLTRQTHIGINYDGGLTAVGESLAQSGAAS